MYMLSASISQQMPDYRKYDFFLSVVVCNHSEIALGLWYSTPLLAIFQLYRGERSVLLVEKIGVPRENHRPVASH